MELTSKIASLEEEINVLKGEIKTILQEVRTALLARENPFSPETFEPLQPHDLPASIHAAQAPETAPPPAPSAAAGAAVDDAPRGYEAATPPRRHDSPPETPAGSGARRQAWSVQSLAMLTAWAQDTAARLAPADLEVLLSLARYGGLIDADLEALLARLAAPLQADAKNLPRAGVNDYLLALRQLAALAGVPSRDDWGFAALRLAS